MIKFDTFFCNDDDFNSPSLFFVVACFQLPKGSYTAFTHNNNSIKALAK